MSELAVRLTVARAVDVVDRGHRKQHWECDCHEEHDHHGGKRDCHDEGCGYQSHDLQEAVQIQAGTLSSGRCCRRSRLEGRCCPKIHWLRRLQPHQLEPGVVLDRDHGRLGHFGDRVREKSQTTECPPGVLEVGGF